MNSKRSSMKRKHGTFTKSQENCQDFVPWVEDFTPTSIEELAVHKKKISEVHTWIQKSISSYRDLKESPILILNGPPGVGKTATVNAICKIMNAEIFVWSNKHQEKTFWLDDDILSSSRDRIVPGETQAKSFSRFLLQSTKYSLSTNLKRIIIVEEFPNALIRNPSGFHEIIRKYVTYCQCPAIFIISDNVKGDSIENRLFPKDLQLALKIVSISFNSVAPTLLMKILTRINNSSKVRSKYRQLNKFELESIASDSMGDIRNAINSMQFLCMTNFKKPLPVKENSTKLTHSDCSGKKDSSLFLFHALGKILYCKRDASLKTEIDVLPTELKQFERDPLISNPEEVYDKTSISAEAFILFLQENYIPFVENIETAFECSSWFSEADFMSASWSDRDVMNDYTVSMAARGLMFNLTSSSTGKRWRPLHKPQFYEINSKQKQLVNSLKYSFKDSSLSLRELQIDFVPFLTKLQSKHLNPVQLALLKQMGQMNIKRFMSKQTSKVLDEKDCFEPEIDYSDLNTSTNSVNEGDELTDKGNLVPQDEEVIIEEYDF